ncbi:MAG: YqiA/YcfP family alpha/beta fold hydrolase [Planctomycetota bacterium]|jgi:hypothetical protein|nr:YqiA/YcfP family alpha/beta fold hydrolase [Planctomycetota bacterium]
MKTVHYAYLHGFASNSNSTKGTHLSRRFSTFGETLHLPDLNAPSFENQTPSSAIESFDSFRRDQDPSERPWSLIGSSLGGFLAALWASHHPRNTHKLVLLCPGFNLATRWPIRLGSSTMRKWEQSGFLSVTGPDGQPARLHHGFQSDALTHPGEPEVFCPTLIIHGTRDEIVPIESSRDYARNRDHVTLLELEDDHALTRSLPTIENEVLRFLGFADQ